MCRSQQALTQVLSFIRQADDAQLSEMIQAIVKRYHQVYPDWEIHFLSCPKNAPAQQEELLKSILKLQSSE